MTVPSAPWRWEGYSGAGDNSHTGCPGCACGVTFPGARATYSSNTLLRLVALTVLELTVNEVSVRPKI